MTAAAAADAVIPKSGVYIFIYIYMYHWWFKAKNKAKKCV